MSKKNNPAAKKKEVPGFAFQRINYILVIAGILIMGLGFLLMIGGGSDHPAEFSEEIFNTRRLTIAPLLILAGYVIEIIAIMYKPGAKAAEATGEENQ